ncbi:MAG TPA: BadF/BadG/BcrA/BcrD ATPase family protein [Pyrinomonadaceae bacterium]|jgi:N-acetylglucosamine kinase-like BadF-type ATPase
MKKSSRLAKFVSPRQASEGEILLGVDGGGTRTRAVIADSDGRVLGEGAAGPSNPLRVGIINAAAAIREAATQACSASGVQPTEIDAAQVGLAGVRRGDLRARMREALKSLRVGLLQVVTDSEIALYGATDGQPGVVIIAGTGSICCGVNAQGRHACAGGWGPIAGDEGSGSWIARRALQAIGRQSDGRGPQTRLGEEACAYFKVATEDDLVVAIYAPSMTNERIAGFGRCVIETARRGDRVARSIVVEAGRELGMAAVAVIRELRMERGRFQVAYVGGVFAAGRVLLDSVREEVRQLAPGAFLAPPHLPPVIAAARMAHDRLDKLRMAG